MNISELEENIKRSLTSEIELYKHTLILEDNLELKDDIQKIFDKMEEKVRGEIEEAVTELDETLK